MHKKQRLTFHLDGYFWIKVALCLFSVRTLSATPSCELINGVLDCKANNNSDIQQLSNVAENIRLSFYQGHSVNFEDSLFPELPALRSLTIDLNYVDDLSSGGFKQLSNLESLHLENNDPYRPLPELSLKSGTLLGLTALKTLDIKEIGLTQIESGAFQNLTNLNQASITQNKIKSLPDSLFATTQLESLTLSRLGDIQVSSLTFQGLKSLNSFSFYGNKLQTLESSVFGDMLNLQELNLENNELSSMSISTFTGLQNLVRLDLRNNNFTALEYGVFNDLTSLFSLDITNCDLEVVDDGVFEKLSGLKFLKLGGNRLQTITSSTFRGLSGLASLEVENNKITSIAAKAFSNISILHLYNNEISGLDPQTFAGADATVVTLHDNKLTSLSQGVFDFLKNLNHLDLSNNPWECDCSITWLKVWLDSRPANFVLDNANTTSCSSPQDVQGTRLQLYLKLRYSDCNPTTTTLLEPSTTTLPQPSTTTLLEPSTTTLSQPSTTTATVNNMTTAGAGFTGNQDDDSDGLKASVTGIIVGCVFVAVLIIVAVAIFMYCRYKKYAFWAPPKTDRPDGRRPGSDLKYKARHQVGSFYQDPETGSVSALWETESMRSDYRYAIDPEAPEKDSIKNRYVYDNPALNVSDANDNSVVVVDSNGTKVKELPLNVADLAPNGNVRADSYRSSNESVSSRASRVSPVPAHGYDLEEPPLKIADPTEDTHDVKVTNHEEYQMEPLDVQPENAELQEVEDTPDVRLSRDVDTPQSEDYEHLNAEPENPSSGHDYTGLQPAGNGGPTEPGLTLNVNADHSGDYEHLNEPETPPSPHDYVWLQRDADSAEVRVSVSTPQCDRQDVLTGSTDAHGGTAAYTNDAFDVSN